MANDTRRFWGMFTESNFPKLAEIETIDDAVETCDKRAGRHSDFGILFGAAFAIVVLGALVFLVIASSVGPLTKTTIEEGGKTVIKEPVTPAMLIVLPTLAIISAFLASLSRFHLKKMSRWHDYGLAFARIRLATDAETVQDAALIAAPFATISASPELELSALIENLSKLPGKRP